MIEVPQVDPADVPAGATIVDVREDCEWEGGHAAGAQHIALGELSQRLAELPKDEDLYIICHSGGRSQRAAMFLRENRFKAHNIAGGTSAWFEAHLPVESETGEKPVIIH